ncbi:PREDICTED: uncharacterized protein LOC109133031 [Camelina sativa]|uniref:Uncharacterized protein LOC109133031 n=1 Tax=Camelina sativa TaxID=90675 RepID=A0ABM1RQ18_CAMSA|nr:PREDICTED: uncharacterized protein LOC109133031 [Camelina sativa]
MAMKKTQIASLLPSLLLILLSLSFHDPVKAARLHHYVRVHIDTPPSPSCGTEIYHVAGTTEEPCRHPENPSAADP